MYLRGRNDRVPRSQKRLGSSVVYGRGSPVRIAFVNKGSVEGRIPGACPSLNGICQPEVSSLIVKGRRGTGILIMLGDQPAEMWQLE